MFHQNLVILLVEAHDFLTDGRRSTVLSFVTEVENFLSRATSSVIHDAFSHHTDHRTLTRVYIANDCNSHVILVPVGCCSGENCILKLVTFFDVPNVLGLFFAKDSDIGWGHPSLVSLLIGNI